MSLQCNVQLLYVYTELYTDVVGIIVLLKGARCTTQHCNHGMMGGRSCLIIMAMGMHALCITSSAVLHIMPTAKK
jgi:hypothetical protein